VTSPIPARTIIQTEKPVKGSTPEPTDAIAPRTPPTGPASPPEAVAPRTPPAFELPGVVGPTFEDVVLVTDALTPTAPVVRVVVPLCKLQEAVE